jgi:magnesium chelatase subunit D
MIELGAKQKSSPGFGEVVGQEQLKEALLAVTTDPGLDGLLVRGEKGTAKSTTVRALAELLPDQQAVADCPFGCPPADPDRQCPDCRERTDLPVERRPVPLVTLPLGATRERVVGSLSVADAMAGDHEFDPGLLARANRGLLYVDEVNLLEDHLVDVVLDAAASGVNRVERDAVSVTHPAEFTLVGTMNPEEGDLRPQLRDRFALQATVTACEDTEDRVAIIEQALGETRQSGEPDAAVRERLEAARNTLADVSLPEEYLATIAELCREAGVDGHRGDIAIARGARAFAALNRRERVIEPDVRKAAELALPHRARSTPFDDAPDPDEVIDDHFEDGEGDEGDEGDEERGEQTDRTPSDDDTGAQEEGEPDADRDGHPDEPPESDAGEGEPTTGCDEQPANRDEPDGPDKSPEPAPAGGDTDESGEGDRRSGEDSDEPSEDGEQEQGTPLVPGQRRAGVGDSAAPELSAPEVDVPEGVDAGSRADATPSTQGRGARVRTQQADRDGDVDAAASARAAAARGASHVGERDLRQSVRAGEASALVVFVVDASASMRPAMRAAKGTVLELLRDAYQGRDEVAVVTFAGEDAEVVLPPTDSVTMAARHLKELPTADRTPLPAGLRAATEILDRADPGAATVVCVTDGRTNTGDSPVEATREAARTLAEHDTHVLVVDADEGRGLTDLLAEETGGRRVPLAALSADRVDDTF